MIYDITQELFSGQVFLGDPSPHYEKISDLEKGDLYNLTNMEICVHNATHIDAPSHFIQQGKTVDQIDLSRCIGTASVIEFHNVITDTDIHRKVPKNCKRLLIKGSGVLSSNAAKAINQKRILLVGTESQSIGDIENPLPVHLELLQAEVIIIEGLQLEEVEAGTYKLIALPLKLGGLEGSPCRAILV
ncbi:MAG: cyclase family protein, partial [Bacteroidales bacterium]